MNWWFVFLALIVCESIGAIRFVPAAYRRNYAQCRKDKTYWITLLACHSIWITAAFQQWLAPGDFPLWQRLGGVAFFVGGNALVIAARAVNPMFVPALVYIPARLRVRRGVYSAMKHPGYIGLALAAHGVLFLLGQWWAMFPTALYQGLLLGRTIIEDRLLSSPHNDI